MKKLLYILLTVLCASCTYTKTNSVSLAHPYLIMDREAEQNVRKAIASEQMWQDYHNLMIAGADTILSAPTLERSVHGRRLLGVSRECLRRIMLLGYAYRMTGEEKYAQRAEREMQNVIQFSDWNPSHFLDAAEMTTAMAVGYDWLFNYLSDETKQKVAEAIITKGLRPSLEDTYNRYWLNNHNNWNQVCHTGMALGALAIHDRIPELADSIVNRAVEKIKSPMAVYGPDGAYPEGYSYWAYGTTYNILLIEALKTIKGTDFGLSEIPGFLDSGEFIQNMVLGDGQAFNYGDCNHFGRMNPAMLWLVQQNNDPGILWTEKFFFDKANKKYLTNYRFSLCALIWGTKINFDHIPMPTNKTWVSAKGKQPVAIMRTNWEFNKGLSAAIKGGTAQTRHAHLDAGSFIITDRDIRWSMDFGPQDYHSLEELGIDLWNHELEGQRWDVFRYNNQAHNTLTFNDQLQNAEGYSTITESGDNPGFMYAVVDMAPVYTNQVAEAKRGMALVDEKFFVVRDEIKTLNQPTTVRWNMLTSATPKILNEHTMQLSMKGKTLLIQVESSAKISLKTWSTTSPNSYDTPNPNTVFVGFEADLAPGKEETLQVKLIPDGHHVSTKEIQPLKHWKNN